MDLEELERVAHWLHAGNHASPLFGQLDTMRRIDVTGRPYAGLTVVIVLRDVEGDGPEVQARLAACEAAFEAAGDPVGQSYCAFLRGNQALLRGALVDAGHWWSRAHALTPDGGWLEASALAHLALVVYTEKGDLPAALDVIEEALALSRRRNDRRTEGVAAVYGAFLALSTGEFARAEAFLDLGDDVFRELPSDQRSEWALVAAAQGCWRRSGVRVTPPRSASPSRSAGARWPTSAGTRR